MPCRCLCFKWADVSVSSRDFGPGNDPTPPLRFSRSLFGKAVLLPEACFGLLSGSRQQLFFDPARIFLPKAKASNSIL